MEKRLFPILPPRHTRHTGGNLPPSPSIVLFYIATHGYIVGLFFFFLLLWCHSTLYQKLSQPAIGKKPLPVTDGVDATV